MHSGHPREQGRPARCRGQDTGQSLSPRPSPMCPGAPERPDSPLPRGWGRAWKGLGHVSRHLEGNQSPPGTKEGHQAARRPAALTRRGDEARPTPAHCRVGNKLTQVALQPRSESGHPEEAGRPQTNSPGAGKTEEQGFSLGSRLWPQVRGSAVHSGTDSVSPWGRDAPSPTGHAWLSTCSASQM